MDRSDFDSSNCSIARTLGIVGEKWTLLIIRESFYGATRFEQFHDTLGCPRNLLSQRLGLLVEEGILVRSEYREPGSRARMEYHLTDKGMDLKHVLLALREWGDRNEVGCEGRPVITRHAGCGGELSLTLSCSEGHTVEAAEEIELVPGPGSRSSSVPIA
ncbi:MAG: helix-turn-helix domain-containing protein [Solirubrobacterales bacterium]